MTYSELQEAVRILGLDERASLRELKARHRELVKRHHPDAGASDEPEAIRLINAAYAVVLNYVGEYRFSFAEEEFYEQNPEERFRHQFMEYFRNGS